MLEGDREKKKVCLKTRKLKLVKEEEEEEEEDINCHGPIKCPFCSVYLLKIATMTFDFWTAVVAKLLFLH